MLEFRFIDSFRFMASSLDKLSSLLPHYKKVTTKAKWSDPEDFELFTRKGVLCYDFITNEKVLDEKKDKLPDIEHFYNQLTGEACKESEYQLAERIWEKFNCKTLGEYSDIYLQTDVLLLVDIFENFREECLQHYEIDPAHFVTLASFAFQEVIARRSN